MEFLTWRLRRAEVKLDSTNTSRKQPAGTFLPLRLSSVTFCGDGCLGQTLGTEVASHSALQAPHLLPCCLDPGTEWSGTGRGKPLPCPHNRNKSLQGRARLSPGPGGQGLLPFSPLTGSH